MTSWTCSIPTNLIVVEFDISVGFATEGAHLWTGLGRARAYMTGKLARGGEGQTTYLEN